MFFNSFDVSFFVSSFDASCNSRHAQAVRIMYAERAADTALQREQTPKRSTLAASPRDHRQDVDGSMRQPLLWAVALL